MELAVNTMSKGLQLDTNPMVLSNDTLSDCLNGTIITMNGNEVILQNDMGNRRVNNAFLPPGYLPIGIKEYGGIIYIAAYNPITNQSLIGSFPSPQRKFNDIDNDAILLLLKFFDEKYNNIFAELFKLRYSKTQYHPAGINLIQLKFIKSDTLFVMLIDDSAIYPGDKFIICSLNIQANKNILTNYDNTEGDKIKTPKNKDYTLYVGVLNSLNEFMDITPTLHRWTDNLIVNFNEFNYQVSDKFKFNYGYFIPNSFSNNLLLETQSDAEFIRARQALPINTYGSKLIGPLCLRAKFNHVENFDYNISGYKSDENGKTYVYLIVEGFFTYNCLDLGEEITEDNRNLINYTHWNSYLGVFENDNNIPPPDYTEPTLYLDYGEDDSEDDGGDISEGEDNGGSSDTPEESESSENIKYYPFRFSVPDTLYPSISNQNIGTEGIYVENLIFKSLDEHISISFKSSEPISNKGAKIIKTNYIDYEIIPDTFLVFDTDEQIIIKSENAIINYVKIYPSGGNLVLESTNPVENVGQIELSDNNAYDIWLNDNPSKNVEKVVIKANNTSIILTIDVNYTVLTNSVSLDVYNYYNRQDIFEEDLQLSINGLINYYAHGTIDMGLSYDIDSIYELLTYHSTSTELPKASLLNDYIGYITKDNHPLYFSNKYVYLINYTTNKEVTRGKFVYDNNRKQILENTGWKNVSCIALKLDTEIKDIDLQDGLYMFVIYRGTFGNATFNDYVKNPKQYMQLGKSLSACHTNEYMYISVKLRTPGS